MKRKDKPLVWLHGEIKTPPMSSAARTEAGFLLRKLQMGSGSQCLIHDQCHRLVRDVTNSVSMTKTRRGVLCIESINDAIVPTVKAGFDFMIPPQEEAYEEHKEETT